MKIRLIPLGGLRFNVYFEKTRAKEEKGVFLTDVTEGNLKAALTREVRRMRKESEPAGQGSP